MESQTGPLRKTKLNPPLDGIEPSKSDEGYPGSTYRLAYRPSIERLEGTYFQATLKQTFTVEFVRMEEQE